MANSTTEEGSTSETTSTDVAVNTPPTISGTPAGSVAEEENYSFTPTTSDADGDSLSFSIVNKPIWAGFSSTSGTLSGTPSYEQAGTYDNIQISVSDGTETASLPAFSITVNDINRAPSISGTPATSVSENATYSFTPVASDADGDSLSFTIVNMPSWASFSTTTGTLSGTPGASDVGSYGNISISVSDGKQSSALNTFAITVTEDTQSVTIGSPTLGSATIVDANIVLAWSQQNDEPDGGYDVVINGIDDGQNRTTLHSATISGLDTSISQCFIIEARYVAANQFPRSNELCTEAVAPSNTKPVISGSPATSVSENATYSFTPVASDADGDSLSFSIVNKPVWANFSATTGTLSGTPSTGDIGSYDNIQISVSDGTETASLPAFSILVDAAPQAGTGSASLSWTAPTTRTDGSILNLSDIGGYCIYMGTSSDNLQMIIDLNDGAAQSYTVENLQSGTYYFAVTAYDMDGNHSSYSDIASKIIY